MTGTVNAAHLNERFQSAPDDVERVVAPEAAQRWLIGETGRQSVGVRGIGGGGARGAAGEARRQGRRGVQDVADLENRQGLVSPAREAKTERAECRAGDASHLVERIVVRVGGVGEARGGHGRTREMAERRAGRNHEAAMATTDACVPSTTSPHSPARSAASFFDLHFPP